MSSMINVTLLNFFENNLKNYLNSSYLFYMLLDSLVPLLLVPAILPNIYFLIHTQGYI